MAITSEAYEPPQSASAKPYWSRKLVIAVLATVLVTVACSLTAWYAIHQVDPVLHRAPPVGKWPAEGTFDRSPPRNPQ